MDEVVGVEGMSKMKRTAPGQLMQMHELQSRIAHEVQCNELPHTGWLQSGLLSRPVFRPGYQGAADKRILLSPVAAGRSNFPLRLNSIWGHGKMLMSVRRNGQHGSGCIPQNDRKVSFVKQVLRKAVPSNLRK